jgi:RNA recognition motif-containing protein
MATKIYVGNLSYDATDESLRSLFTEAGNVTSAQVVTDRYTGQARGFGFVEMSTDEEARKAIASINGRQHGGRSLTVNEAKPKERTGSGGGAGAGSNRW